MADTKPSTAFISGPLDPTDEYFETYYKPKIDQAIAKGHKFIIGPVRGIDARALRYLLENGVAPGRVTVYMAPFEYDRPTWLSSFTDLSVHVHRVEGAVTTQDRDAAMTRDSDYDILRYLTEEEAKKLYGKGWWPKVTNTELNERRRAAIMSQKNVIGEGERGEGERGEEEEGVEGKGNVELVEGIVHGTRRRTRLGRLLRLGH